MGPLARRRGAHPPLVVVANRLPFTTETTPTGPRFRRSPGGLVAALDPALSERGGVWIGWPGVATEGAESVAEMMPLDASTDKVKICPIPLSNREVSLYYGGFANRTLWPLFHYFLDRTRIDAEAWRVYDRVNLRFAEAVAAASDDESLVWVQDYQLLRVPRYLRRLAPGRRVGLFLHIPFPAYDVFRVLPWSRDLMRGILSADLVGFQIAEHAQHFLVCAERLLGCPVDYEAGIARFGGREVTVGAFPIGIDVAHFERLAHQAGPRPDDGVVRVLGLDRLDYTKGILERLNALERLLDNYPEYRRRVVLVQLAIPSRTRVAEYRALKREVDETVGRINGRFSDAEWTPIHYLVRSVPQEELVALYRHSHIALVTPLRDGMNLVAKEYVASQGDEGGVLILSELAGAAAELQEALLVNPFDIDSVAEALHRALSMSEEERRARLSALRDRVRANDVRRWTAGFLEALEAAAERAHGGRLSPAERLRRELRPWLAERPAIALCIDFDGVLDVAAESPADVRMVRELRRALERAAKTPNLDVIMVSSRGLADVRRTVAVPGLTYIGSGGFEIEGPGISYRHPDLPRQMEELTAAAEELAALEVAGGRVEQRGASVSYHVKGVDHAVMGDAERQIDTVLRRHSLKAGRGDDRIDARPRSDWDKGRATLHVLAIRHGKDWPSRIRALYFGGPTDEDAFRALHGIGRSVLVGAIVGTSAAEFSLPDSPEALELLHWLASGAGLVEET